MILFSDIIFDEYSNEMNTLPKNLQQLVTEAMQKNPVKIEVDSTTTSIWYNNNVQCNNDTNLNLFEHKNNILMYK